ncbi:MAG: surface-adhesin E family protein [Caulobacterales bacterium]
MIKFAGIICLALGSCLSAVAEEMPTDYRLVGNTSWPEHDGPLYEVQSISCVDASKIEIIEPDQRRTNVWMFISEKASGPLAGGYLLLDTEYDCSKRRFRIDTMKGFDKTEATPTGYHISEPEPWKDVGPKTAQSDLLKFMCGEKVEDLPVPPNMQLREHAAFIFEHFRLHKAPAPQ